MCCPCLHNRNTIDALRTERDALIEVYVVAARLRTSPVPFDDHFALVDAVDACRSVLEPPVDDYGPAWTASIAAPPPSEKLANKLGRSTPKAEEAGGWQQYVAAYPRKEFLVAFREAHAALHRLWTDAVGKPDYDKETWKTIDNALARFARDAAENVGIGRGVPAVSAPAVSAETANRPRVGICVLVVREGKILLGKRRGSHGDGEYASPGGHLEHLESFQACAAREVLEETGLQIGELRFLRVLNCVQYAPKHYIDIAFVAPWVGGEPEVREPDKVERWDWYAIDALPSPVFAMLPSAIAALIHDDRALICQESP